MRASNGTPSRFVCWNMGVLIHRNNPMASEARFQSMIPLLESLKSKGCTNLLVASTKKEQAEVTMDAFDMAPHFSALFSNEDVLPDSKLVRYLSILKSLGISYDSASDQMIAICKGIEHVPVDVDIVSLIYPNSPSPELIGEMLSFLIDSQESMVRAHTVLHRIPASHIVDTDAIRGQIQLPSGAIVDVGLVQNPFSPLQWNRVMAVIKGVEEDPGK
ncbi:MAG: hypothetical protein PHF60_01410 [Candidatus ainarchaeum sp.]|nr:hypothetical protein [Candidatus ainarchaeum sp.]